MDTRCIKGGWDNICVKVKNAVVFLDCASAQSLHWNGGAIRLIQSGAINLKEFSSFECGADEERKAVFIISGVIDNVIRTILQDILHSSSFQYVLLATSLCPAMHGQIRFGNPDTDTRAFHELEDHLLEWMGNMNYTAEVFYAPFMCASITNNLFILPEHAHLFPLLPHEKNKLREMHLKENPGAEKIDLQYTHLPAHAQLKLKLLVCSLNGLLEQLSINEDCCSLGETSDILASELAALSWAKARRKNSTRRASLLLIDRTLDLSSAVGHHSETLLDHILKLLPRLPGHCSDVSVDMSPLSSIPNSCCKGVLPLGCLAQPNEPQAMELLNTLSAGKHKESLMEVNRKLVEAASSCNLPLPTKSPQRINHSSINSIIKLFKGNSASIKEHCGLLQLALATSQSLGNHRYSSEDGLLAIEKGLLQNLHETESQSPLIQLASAINQDSQKSAGKKLLSVEDVFGLLVYVYSLLSPDDVKFHQEEMLKVALERVLLCEDLGNLPKFMQELIGEEKTEDKIFGVLDTIFVRLRTLTRARDGLKQFNELVEGGGCTSVATIRPLLKQVAQEIFSGQNEIVDIHYKSTGFRDLLKSGFGLFMNVSKPRASDHPLLIVFVVGGITSTELRHIKESLAARKTDTQVLVGSTCLLERQDILHKIFVQDNIN